MDRVIAICASGKATMTTVRATESMAMTVPCPAMDRADAPRVLMVVPTLGQRTDYLAQTLQSIREQPLSVDITVVCPASAQEAASVARAAGATVIDDPGSLPGAINLGIASASDHEFVTWLGDDDLLEPESLPGTVAALDREPAAVLAYGWCRYIDPDGRQLWINKTGKLAEAVLAWGPQLIPQPGMLVRLKAWSEVGGLDESLTLAFDFDLILKLRKVGALTCVNRPVSAFRWHPQSLTVSSRSRNLDESELVKRRYLQPWQQRIAWTWEGPVRLATRIAAWNVNRKAQAIMAGPRT